MWCVPRQALQLATAGEKRRFFIEAFDRFRNPITKPGYTFSVSLTGQEDGRRVLGTTSFDEATGMYVGSYTATHAGPYSMHVTRSGRGVYGYVGGDLVQSPFPGPGEALIVQAAATSGAALDDPAASEC